MKTLLKFCIAPYQRKNMKIDDREFFSFDSGITINKLVEKLIQKE